MNEVAAKIAAEIAAQGAIPFARFMDHALYCPDLGYYEQQEDTVGRGGDYFTSVSVGSLFGELLALQFAAWLPSAGPVALLEAGAHNGQLAADVLGWLRQWRPAVFARLTYWLLEPSPRRRAWQQRRLAPFAERLRWAADFEELRRSGRPEATPGFRGIIFANELLDAFPVHRYGWDTRQQTWFEWGVGLRGGQFVWQRLDDPAPSLAADLGPCPAELLAALPEGYVLEDCPAARAWWRAAAGVLAEGRLFTLDYGWLTEEWLSPARPEGTLRAYHRHQVTRDVLARPGEQDLTAHVNFSALEAAGQSAGLVTEGCESQERFLTAIAARIWQQQERFAEWTPILTRQFRTLTHPAQLGRTFRVLGQKRLGQFPPTPVRAR